MVSVKKELSVENTSLGKTGPISKGQRKKLKAKQKKQNGTFIKEESQVPSIKSESDYPDIKTEEPGSPDLHASNDNIPEPSPLTLDPSEDNKEIYAEFASVFSKFNQPIEVQEEESKPNDKGDIIYSDDEMFSDENEYDDDEKAPLSRKKQRKLNRLSVAELKRAVKKPEIVEWVDVSSADPKLLVTLKSQRNTIPVPSHWSQKKDYLQGKRGIEKPPFQLPAFIADTGIATQRDAIKEKEEGQSLKQKTRERVQPKMGKIDIDYQKLHDAFFKFQTKPKMSNYGQIYYEGKEFETNLKERRPGDLSTELKEALSIPPLAPPPWLIAMQRYGPPPSYPNLRIPGLSAPIPEGAQWGFHPGGWGRPPVDEYNRPLYGDVFGLSNNQDQAMYEPVEKTLWGELESEEEESEEEEEAESEEEEAEDEGDQEGQLGETSGLETPAMGPPGGLETPSGMASVTSTVPGGLETPSFLELRKRRGEEQPEDDGRPKQLYHVIPERQANVSGFMGSERQYDVGAVNQQQQQHAQQPQEKGRAPPILGQEERKGKRKADTVEVTLDASDLEGLSQEELQRRYEASKRATGPGSNLGAGEDLSQVYAEEMAKRRKKNEKAEKFKF